MGLRSWFRKNTAPKPRRPWVRPEFLGLALVAGAVLGLAFAATTTNEQPPATPQQRSEYIGVNPDSLPLVDCAPICEADRLLLAWQRSHPQANVIDVQPRYEDGRLVGYEILYEE